MEMARTSLQKGWSDCKILLNKANRQLNVGDFNQMVLEYQYLIFLVNSHQLSIIVIKIRYICSLVW